jgi:predicted DsbA family dithiol-disulfide isomerase
MLTGRCVNAVQAAFAAAKQSPEKFIDFCRTVYEHQDEFSKSVAESQSQGALKEVFVRIAESLGLDTSSFSSDLDSDAVLLDVKESQRQGIMHCV